MKNLISQQKNDYLNLLFQKNISDLFALLVIFFICGRFYFFYGFSGHLKPIAPLVLIFIKDVVLISICCFYFLFRQNNSSSINKKIFIVWLVTLIAISLIHFKSKSIADWGQHYIRNILLVLLSAPAIYTWSSKHKNSFVKIIFWAGILNIVAAIIQILAAKQALLGGTRPLGLVGDPTSLTIILFIFLFCIPFYNFTSYINFFLILISGFIINISGSLSGTLAAITSFLMLAAIWALNSIIRKKIIAPTISLKKIIVICSAFIISFLIPTNGNLDSLFNKTKVYIYHMGYLNQKELAEHNQAREDEGHLYESMKNGRTFSTKTAINRFENLASVSTEESLDTKILKVLFGNFIDPVYGRYDSTPTVLIMNWGVIVLLLFYLTILYTFYISIKKMICSESISSPIHLICFFCLCNITICGFLNSVWYRSPINFILLISITILLNSNVQFMHKTNLSTTN